MALGPACVSSKVEIKTEKLLFFNKQQEEGDISGKHLNKKIIENHLLYNLEQISISRNAKHFSQIPRNYGHLHLPDHLIKTEMEIIEFLKTTERKNIRSYIGMKVKEKMRENEEILQERQQMLRNILEFEEIKYNEELVQLVHEKLSEQFRKRLDWVNTKYMERIRAEEELLKLKDQQRELENCEQWRHFQSKQLLLDSKKGQLYQMEDKKLRIQKERDIDQMWQDVINRLDYERERQEIYKIELLKVIEKANLLKNQEINENNKKQQHLKCRKDKKDFQEENQKAVFMEERYRKDEKLRKFLNTARHNQTLKSQIATNVENKLMETQLLLTEARSHKELEDKKSFSELKQTVSQKIGNNEWHKLYLKNSLKGKEQKIKQENEFERMYSNSGCVLQQGPRKPYGKNTR